MSLGDMRVVDLSQQLPGPYMTLLLSSLGADVIKVEPPGGDAARYLDPAMFEQTNAGKRSVSLDLKSTQGRAALYELVDDADVFVEGFRPGVTQRLGCDASTLACRRPNLIYCSISGYGQVGPLAHRPTHDLSLQAIAGALVSGQSSDRIGVPWVDLAAATTAALAVVAAWHQGGPVYLDMSLLDAARAWTEVKASAVRDRQPTYGVFAARDGEVVIAILEDDMWSRLCQALAWRDWIDEPTLARYRGRLERAAEVRSRLERNVAAVDVATMSRLAGEFDLPIGPAAAGALPSSVEQLAVRPSGPSALPEVLVRPLRPEVALEWPVGPPGGRLTNEGVPCKRNG